MSNRTSGQLPEDIVDRGAAALRHAQTPAGPSEELLNKTLARLGAVERSGSIQRGWWTMRVVRRSALAAGVVLVVTAGLIALMLGRGAGVAFADVVEQVKAAKAVRCKMVVEVESPAIPGAPAGGAKVAQESEALMVAPGWTIVTTPTMKTVMSVEKGRMLTLMLHQKQAIVVDIKDQPAQAGAMVNVLDFFRNVDGSKGKPLGNRNIDGKATRGFEASQGGFQMNVWADAATDLPVLVELTPTTDLMVRGKYTMKDFDWNPTYDASELSVEVPAGYTATNANLNLAAASEKDVVEMLRTFAEYGGGKFPQSLGMEGLSAAIAQHMAQRDRAETAGMTNEQKQQWMQKVTAEMMQKITPVSRAWRFMGDATQGSQWRYAGGGVQQGEKGRPVLWYKAPSGTWRVIDADLAIHDGRDDQLPQGEPVNLGVATPPAGTPASLPSK